MSLDEENNKSLEDKYEELETTNQELQAKIDVYERMLGDKGDKKNPQVDTLRRQLENNKKDYEAKITDLQQQLAQARRTSPRSPQGNTLEDAVEEKETQIQELRARLEVYEKSNEVNKSNTQTETARKEFENSKKEYEAKITDLQQQLTQAQQALRKRNVSRLREPDSRVKNRCTNTTEVRMTDLQNLHYKLASDFLDFHVEQQDADARIAKKALESLWQDFQEVHTYANLLKKEKHFKEKYYRDRFENDTRVREIRREAETVIRRLLETLCLTQEELERLSDPARPPSRIPVPEPTDLCEMAKSLEARM